MDRSFGGLYPSKVSNAAASVLRCIAVQQLSPEAPVGNPQMITQPGDRSASPDYSYPPDMLAQLTRISGIGSLGKLQIGYE